jgi:hypothetical protein
MGKSFLLLVERIKSRTEKIKNRGNCVIKFAGLSGKIGGIAKVLNKIAPSGALCLEKLKKKMVEIVENV